MHFVIKSVSWIDGNEPMTGVAVEEVFSTKGEAMVYVDRKLKEFREDKKRYTVEGRYPQVIVHDLKNNDWIQFYGQEKLVRL